MATPYRSKLGQERLVTTPVRPPGRLVSVVVAFLDATACSKEITQETAQVLGRDTGFAKAGRRGRLVRLLGTLGGLQQQEGGLEGLADQSKAWYSFR